MPWLAVVLIGAFVGLFGGLLGKGGASLATPLLHAAGVPAMAAVASPLPATIPSAFAALFAYRREGLVDQDVLRWSLAFGMPATIAGAVATRWIGGGPIVLLTNVVIALLGIRFMLSSRPSTEIAPGAIDRPRLAMVAIVVGFLSGLLANSGGFLLAPLYVVVLRMPIKQAFATSLAVATALAVPGTAVHWALGHIDWVLVAMFAAAAIPLSFLGGQIAVHTRPERLERIYGIVLAAVGIGLLSTVR